MDYNTATVTRTPGISIEINKVLKNTYLLLSATMIFSAVMAAVSMSMNASHPGFFIWIAVTFGLLFAVHKTANSSMGIVLTFAFTGWLGYTLGPMLNMYTAVHGSGIVMQALGGTGLIFFALSGYVLTTKKDFSFLRGILFTGLMVVIFSMIFYYVGSAFFGLQITGFSLALSSIIIILMSGFILYDTSSIIRGEQTNYVMATVSMYLNLYNIFIHLLSLLSAFDD